MNEATHGTKGVLLINLGTPDAPTASALRRYLGEFLMDRRVIEIPFLFRWLLVKGIIINFRSAKSAKAYRQIWTEQGSPLLVNSLALRDGMRNHLGKSYQVELGMRYGNPSIESALHALLKNGINDVQIIPLYPQYSASTAGSSFDALAIALKKLRRLPSIRFVDAYSQSQSYIDALAASIRLHWENTGQTSKKRNKLMMSFHGLPKKYSTRGDPYEQQCRDTAKHLAAALSLNDDDYMLVFQSRFGAEEWLQPYCDKTLESLPSKGVKSVDIICPGFSVDCLETLEEIGQENRDIFLDAGGTEYNYIPCLNDSAANITILSELLDSSA